MQRAIQTVARLVRAAHEAYRRKWSFLALCVLLFSVNVSTLASFDLLPERIPLKQSASTAVLPEVVLSASVVASAPEVPVRLAIPTLRLDATIANPSSIDIQVLDAELLKGAVRYPTSARLGENGNVVVFGHSSYLPVVHNPAYKLFDGIQDLKAGETILVYSADTVYTYAVIGVEKTKAENGAISLQVSGRLLTLATCDSFGSKSDRFVVTAELVKSSLIAT